MQRPVHYKELEVHLSSVHVAWTNTPVSDINQVPGRYPSTWHQIGPAHQQHHCESKQDPSFPPSKSEDWCHQNQTTGIQVTCEASPGVCQHHLGSSHKQGHLKDQDGPKKSCLLCPPGLQTHSKCWQHDWLTELAHPWTSEVYVACLAMFYQVVNRLAAVKSPELHQATRWRRGHNRTYWS